MKTCKKYLFPLIALTLCLMMLFSTGAIMADDPVTAQPADPEVYSTTAELDIGGIVGEVIGDVDPSTSEEIREGIYESQGILRNITEFIDKISAFLSGLLNAILGNFQIGNLF